MDAPNSQLAVAPVVYSHYSGAQLPKECDVVLDFYSLHRDPTVFPDPEVWSIHSAV